MTTHLENNFSSYRPETFSLLLKQYASAPIAEPSMRWLLLEALHVVGQTRWRPHLRTHWLMLVQALRDRDWNEAAGQLFRLAIAPLGHALGRLPIGNSGRSNISAFQPMPVREDIAEVISLAAASAHTNAL
ncbi:MAG: DUF3703 domain-containing protein [Burkholderiaceae bacterium]|jgi:hypothetical protein|nr:DUF3703 domain-containing protein [Burkholderiaceae bacterium]